MKFNSLDLVSTFLAYNNMHTVGHLLYFFNEKTPKMSNALNQPMFLKFSKKDLAAILLMQPRKLYLEFMLYFFREPTSCIISRRLIHIQCAVGNFSWNMNSTNITWLTLILYVVWFSCATATKSLSSCNLQQLYLSTSKDVSSQWLYEKLFLIKR